MYYRQSVHKSDRAPTILLLDLQLERLHIEFDIH